MFSWILMRGIAECYVLLSVLLIAILVNNQLDAQFFFSYICLFHLSTCFEQPSAHHQDSQLYQYDLWYMSLYAGDINESRIYTIDCPDDEHMVARNM